MIEEEVFDFSDESVGHEVIEQYMYMSESEQSGDEEGESLQRQE